MSTLTIYAIPPLVSALSLFSLAVVTLVSTGRNRLWRVFAGFCLVMGLSSLFGFLVEATGQVVMAYVRLVIFFALTALSFANLYGIGMTGYRFGSPGRHRRVMSAIIGAVVALWAVTILMLFLTDWVVAAAERGSKHGLRLRYGPAMWVLLGLYFAGTIRNFFFLLQAYRQSRDPTFRDFVGLNLLAFHTVFAPAIWLLFVLPVFGFPTQVLAFLAFPVSVVMFYVAIVRYQVGRVRDLNVTLEKRVEKRTNELKQTQTRLAQSERMASLGHLVAGVAHEMNNPVGAVRSMAASVTTAVGRLKARASAGPVDTGQMNEVFEVVENAGRVIEEGTQRITQVVDDLKSFARLDEPDLQRVDINEELGDTMTLLEGLLKPGVTIEEDFSPVPEILCYPAQLNQVVLNLLVNANEAIVDKGTIALATRPVDRGVRITVTDDGPGIGPDDLERVFEPGFTTKGRGVGTGLGLAICYQIVQDHDGTIRATSEPGKGATFTLELPTAGPSRERGAVG